MNFDPGDTDLVRLLMMSVDTEEDATPAANELVLTEVQPPVFLAKVTAKTIQHVLRDEPAVKNNFILRDVTGSNLEDGTFDFELDLMPQIKYKDAGELLENKIFPLVKENIQVDLGSDQTSLHNPWSGGYYPAGLSFEESDPL